jgi:hypothetical protein
MVSTSFILPTGHTVLVDHHIFSGKKIIYVDGKLTLTTKRSFFETENSTTFDIGDRSYTLHTMPLASGKFLYNVSETEEEDTMNMGLLSAHLHEPTRVRCMS